jgi:hypothetical protein
MAERNGPKSRENIEREPQEFQYRPPTNLPDPLPRDGYRHRWIRASMLNEPDQRNMSMRLREGWEPCKKSEYDELQIVSDTGSDSDTIEIGGLILCRASEEMVMAREKYYRQQNQAQIDSVDHNFMRENDPRMPLLQPERKTEVSFGNGRPRNG